MNRIVTGGTLGTQTIQTFTLTNAFKLSSVDNRYCLIGDGVTPGEYTKNGTDPTLSQSTIFTNSGNFVVVTYSRPAGTGVYFGCLKSGSYYNTISHGDNDFIVGIASNGYRFALLGTVDTPVGVRAINNVNSAPIGYNNATEQVMTGTYTAANTHMIGFTAAVRTKYTLYGIQVYGGLTGDAAGRATALAIVQKAMAYYGVA